MTTSPPIGARNTVDARRPGISLRCGLVLCLVFFGPAIFFGFQADYVLAAVCALAGATAFGGYRLGAVAMAGSIAAIAAAIKFAPALGYAMELRFTQWFGTTGLLNRVLTIGVIGLGITIAVTGVTAWVARRACRRYPTFDSLNRWCGFGVGAAEGLVACLFFLGGMLMIGPMMQEQTQLRVADSTRGQVLSKVILATTVHTRASRLGPIIEAYNPFAVFPELNKVEEVQQSVRLLSDPREVAALLDRPDIKELQQRPEVKTAVEKLMEDPRIRNAMQSGKQFDRSMAMILLNHPAVLELIDQPGFVEAASKAISSADLIVRSSPHGFEAASGPYPAEHDNGR